MAKPIVSVLTSINAWVVGALNNYQASATGIPTSWAATGLPSGCTVSSGGLISGVPTVPGLYVVSLTATNGDGTSDPMVFPIGVEIGHLNSDWSIEIDVDYATLAVTRAGAAATDPILQGKMGDTLLIAIGIMKGGILQEMPITAIGMAFREFMDETDLVITDGNFAKQGSANTARYLIKCYLNPATLAGVLSNYDGDTRTFFNAITEIQFTVTQASLTGGDPEVAIRSTQNFTMALDLDLVPDA